MPLAQGLHVKFTFNSRIILEKEYKNPLVLHYIKIINLQQDFNKKNFFFKSGEFLKGRFSFFFLFLFISTLKFTPFFQTFLAIKKKKLNLKLPIFPHWKKIKKKKGRKIFAGFFFGIKIFFGAKWCQRNWLLLSKLGPVPIIINGLEGQIRRDQFSWRRRIADQKSGRENKEKKNIHKKTFN